MESPVRRSKESKKGRFNPDLNNMEHVNSQLKGKLKILTAEMKDAAERMNSMTIEMNTIRNDNLVYKDRLAEMEQENALLVSQIEEMANERAERDAIIEEFGTAVEARIVEWKEILDEKDSTISKLKENLMYAASDRLANALPDERTHAEIQQLIQDIDRRDEIIAELQSKLSEAVVEINESSVLIEKFKSDGKTKDSSKRGTREQREMNKKMYDADKRINTLENLLERAEKDAKVKSEQLCEALAILNKYEDENTSLTEALEEIKDQKLQIEKKNRHIEDLVDVVNRLENENSHFEEAIIVLREKLGITEEDESSIEDLILQRQQGHDEKIEEMQRQYNQLSSENVDLKFEIRKLKTALKESLKNKFSKTNGISSDGETIEELSLRSESKKEHVELRRIKENIKWVIDENEALRQGMHEILDCIHNQDGKSIVTIQSQTLENLLEALDARHLAGWYHPAMRLQGRVNYLQGSNAELRAQLQQIRQNQLLLQEQLQRSSSVEEGECSQQGDATESVTPDMKSNLQESPSLTRTTPKSAQSGQSQTADSGRASGKAGESDEIQQAEDDEPMSESRDGTSLMDDEDIGKKSEEVYAMAKEIIAQESDFKRALNDAEKQRKLLETQIIKLKKNLANYISPDVYNELRVKYLEANMRLRTAFEDKYAVGDAGVDAKDVEFLRNKAIQELRDELVSLHKQLSELTLNSANNNNIDVKTIRELENGITELKAENERLRKAAEMAHEESLIHRAIDSTVLAEFNELRQRILRFEMDDGQEIKEVASLSFELANYKVIETELREQKKNLEHELSRMRDELEAIKKEGEAVAEESRKAADCRDYVEIIEFLQHQYAGSTSLSAWERYEASLNKLNNDRNEAKELITKMNNESENLKMQHETLTARLQIVEQLKEMLEQQIGSSEVQDIMKRFTSENRQVLEESKFRMQVSKLEEEVKNCNVKIADYEGKLSLMELEINKVQKAWKVQKVSSIKRLPTADKVTETDKETKVSVPLRQTATKSMQTELMIRSVETQCVLCCKREDGVCSKDNRQMEAQKDVTDRSEIDTTAYESGDDDSTKEPNVALLQEQLSQALALASERSISLSKHEAQLAEYRAKIEALTKLLEARNAATPLTNHGDGELSKGEGGGGTSHEALQSSIKSLQRIVAQKEETIARYQGMLKEDRDKHSEAAASLQEEIKSLKKLIAERHAPPTSDNALSEIAERPERDSPGDEGEVGVERLSLLREKISRLETELSISGQLAERWHRLAEDRLRHMDSSIARLETQHREEIKSYRTEIAKRQHEISELRCQLSENRCAPSTKTEVLSFMKALQIKDNRLADEIENELEEHVAVTSQRLSTTYEVEDSRVFECGQSQQSHVDNLRRQLQAVLERERSMKNEIKELQRQLSRKYMAVKVQDKKASRREMQLEKKVKELEEELHEAKEMLDRHFAVQQAKRAKTAEDLGLWEKLKKWQQTAERLKERLRDKTDECQRLQSNYDKLRILISCLEREKWFLRGKFSCKNSESSGCSSSVVVAQPSVHTPTSDEIVARANETLVMELQLECQELRDRVKELVDRLTRQTCIAEEKKRTVAAFGDDELLNEEIKALLDVNEMLKKENLRLESENFELRLQLERANVNTPRYKETIKHLEKYVELLKNEKSLEPCGPPRRDGTQRTKVELERTVVTLQKLLEKLQNENKKLRSSAPESEFAEQQCNCIYLREEYEHALQRIVSLETDLELAEKKALMMQESAVEKPDDCSDSEVTLLRQQLAKKSELLQRVKDLLTKAAMNEKALRQRIHQLEFNQTLSAIPECETPLGITQS